ncbi:MAG: hypothetical protein F6J96_26720 [Symploca sp. SIO1C2]|nr:hypothetical protein [Symploca sp. SIO1C2]
MQPPFFPPASCLLPPAFCFLQLLLIAGCDNLFVFGSQLSQPSEAAIEIQDDYITTLNPDDVALLQRYFSGNSRWEVRKEENQIYAIRKEKIDGEYQTTINGFYFIDTEEGWHQTRLIVSFGKVYGWGQHDQEKVTIVTPKKGATVKTIVEEPYSATSGYSSYLILLGSGINIEVYEQSSEPKREFTVSAIDSVNHELKTALKHREAIQQQGKVPVPEFYPE